MTDYKYRFWTWLAFKWPFWRGWKWINNRRADAFLRMGGRYRDFEEEFEE